MAGVEAPWEAAMGVHQRGEGGGRRRGGRGCAWGGRAKGGGMGWPLRAAGCLMRALCRWLAAVREEGRRRRKEKRGKKRKGRKENKKGKNIKIFSNLKISEK
jgi:hypothetical protein